METLITRGHVDGVPKLRAALGSIQSEVQRSGGDVLGWLWLAFPIAQENAAHELWDDEAWHQLATHAVRLARDAGALAVLPAALVYRAGVHVQAGEFTAAAAVIQVGRSDYRRHRPFAGEIPLGAAGRLARRRDRGGGG